jgi:Ca2+-binding EF-hand superfamily protein
MQTEKAIAKLFEREIDFHVELEHLKKDLENCPDYHIRKAFKAIDEHNFKFINHANLKSFLRKMGHQPIRKEIVAILRRLDLDGDSKITF